MAVRNRTGEETKTTPLGVARDTPTRSLAELEACELIGCALGVPDPERRAVGLALLESAGGLSGLATALGSERAWSARSDGVRGLQPGAIAALRAGIELGRRSMRSPLRPGDRLRDPAQVFALIAARSRHLRQECFWVLLLDSRHRLIREVEVHRGSLDQSLVHPREVFRPAISAAAAALVAVHNHPSGDPEPSAEDRDVTCRLAAAGDLIGIPLLDHVVVGAGAFTSLRARGFIPAQGGPLRGR